MWAMAAAVVLGGAAILYEMEQRAQDRAEAAIEGRTRKTFNRGQSYTQYRNLKHPRNLTEVDTGSDEIEVEDAKAYEVYKQKVAAEMGMFTGSANTPLFNLTTPLTITKPTHSVDVNEGGAPVMPSSLPDELDADPLPPKTKEQIFDNLHIPMNLDPDKNATDLSSSKVDPSIGKVDENEGIDPPDDPDCDITQQACDKNAAVAPAMNALSKLTPSNYRRAVQYYRQIRDYYQALRQGYHAAKAVYAHADEVGQQAIRDAEMVLMLVRQGKPFSAISRALSGTVNATMDATFGTMDRVNMALADKGVKGSWKIKEAAKASKRLGRTVHPEEIPDPWMWDPTGLTWGTFDDMGNFTPGMPMVAPGDNSVYSTVGIKGANDWLDGKANFTDAITGLQGDTALAVGANKMRLANLAMMVTTYGHEKVMQVVNAKLDAKGVATENPLRQFWQGLVDPNYVPPTRRGKMVYDTGQVVDPTEYFEAIKDIMSTEGFTALEDLTPLEFDVFTQRQLSSLGTMSSYRDAFYTSIAAAGSQANADLFDHRSHAFFDPKAKLTKIPDVTPYVEENNSIGARWYQNPKVNPNYVPDAGGDGSVKWTWAQDMLSIGDEGHFAMPEPTRLDKATIAAKKLAEQGLDSAKSYAKAGKDHAIKWGKAKAWQGVKWGAKRTAYTGTRLLGPMAADTGAGILGNVIAATIAPDATPLEHNALAAGASGVTAAGLRTIVGTVLNGGVRGVATVSGVLGTGTTIGGLRILGPAGSVATSVFAGQQVQYWVDSTMTSLNAPPAATSVVSNALGGAAGAVGFQASEALLVGATGTGTLDAAVGLATALGASTETAAAIGSALGPPGIAAGVIIGATIGGVIAIVDAVNAASNIGAAQWKGTSNEHIEVRRDGELVQTTYGELRDNEVTALYSGGGMSDMTAEQFSRFSQRLFELYPDSTIALAHQRAQDTLSRETDLYDRTGYRQDYSERNVGNYYNAYYDHFGRNPIDDVSGPNVSVEHLIELNDGWAPPQWTHVTNVAGFDTSWLYDTLT